MSDDNTEVSKERIACIPDDMIYSFGDPERFIKLPALAERLGVQPVDPDKTRGAILLTMRDGRNYDVIDIINAVLDRLEEAHK